MASQRSKIKYLPSRSVRDSLLIVPRVDTDKVAVSMYKWGSELRVAISMYTGLNNGRPVIASPSRNELTKKQNKHFRIYASQETAIRL